MPDGYDCATIMAGGLDRLRDGGALHQRAGHTWLKRGGAAGQP